MICSEETKLRVCKKSDQTYSFPQIKVDISFLHSVMSSYAYVRLDYALIFFSASVHIEGLWL